MPVETRMWEIDGPDLKPTSTASLDTEDVLQEWLQEDIGIIDDDLLVVGKEVTTDLGDRLDLLAIDPAGQLVVIELKKDQTPRDVVAQVLGYTAWVSNLSYEQLENITRDYLDCSLADAFEERFDDELPDLINEAQRMIVVAAGLDAHVERSLRYLSEEWGVDINAVFFRCFESQDGRQWLVRSWLEEPAEVERRTRTSRGWTASTMDELREMAERNGAEGVWDLMLTQAEKWGLSPHRASVKLSLHGRLPDGGHKKVIGLYPKHSRDGRLCVEMPPNRVTKYFEVSEDKLREILPKPYDERLNRYMLSADDIASLVAAVAVSEAGVRHRG